jgi:hypothetical protein
MTNKIGNEMYHSLILKYQKEIQESKTILSIYFENSVGIGDHPNHLEEMDNLIEKMANADEKIKILESIFYDTYSKL